MLLLWLLVVEALLLRATGRPPEMWIEPGPVGFPWTAWLVILSLALVVFTRGKADRTTDGALMRRIPLLGPVVFLVAIIASMLGLFRRGPRSLAKLGGAEAEWPMPPAPDWLRRAAAVPAILVGESGFRGVLARDLPQLLSQPAAGPSDPHGLELAAALGWGVFLLALPFVCMVIGPRVAAGATTDWRFWLARFGLFAAAAITGSRAVEAVGMR